MKASNSENTAMSANDIFEIGSGDAGQFGFLRLKVNYGENLSSPALISRKIALLIQMRDDKFVLHDQGETNEERDIFELFKNMKKDMREIEIEKLRNELRTLSFE